MDDLFILEKINLKPKITSISSVQCTTENFKESSRFYKSYLLAERYGGWEGMFLLFLYYCSVGLLDILWTIHSRSFLFLFPCSIHLINLSKLFNLCNCNFRTGGMLDWENVWSRIRTIFLDYFCNKLMQKENLKRIKEERGIMRIRY